MSVCETARHLALNNGHHQPVDFVRLNCKLGIFIGCSRLGATAVLYHEIFWVGGLMVIARPSEDDAGHFFDRNIADLDILP
jgi:hypothetical protein